MKAYYTKEKEGYLLCLDGFKCKIPFRYHLGEYVSMDITDEVMDLLVYRYDNDCLEFSYNGESVTKENIDEIFKNENVKFTDLKLRCKGEKVSYD